jgi:hypothetical protein
MDRNSRSIRHASGVPDTYRTRFGPTKLRDHYSARKARPPNGQAAHPLAKTHESASCDDTEGRPSQLPQSVRAWSAKEATVLRITAGKLRSRNCDFNPAGRMLAPLQGDPAGDGLRKTYGGRKRLSARQNSNYENLNHLGPAVKFHIPDRRAFYAREPSIPQNRDLRIF